MNRWLISISQKIKWVLKNYGNFSPYSFPSVPSAMCVKSSTFYMCEYSVPHFSFIFFINQIWTERRPRFSFILYLYFVIRNRIGEFNFYIDCYVVLPDSAQFVQFFISFHGFIYSYDRWVVFSLVWSLHMIFAKVQIARNMNYNIISAALLLAWIIIIVRRNSAIRIGSFFVDGIEILWWV